MNPPPPPQASQPRLQPNDVVENTGGNPPAIYRVIRLVGIGGMGAVYEAIRKSDQSRVALKEILFNPDELEASYFRKLQAAFLKEARILIHLDRESFPPEGASVPRAFDIFQSNSIWYLVMEYLEGKTLSELIGMGESVHPLPAEDVMKWGIQLAYTLEYLHQQEPPLIHADIKPSNIKVAPDGRASLLDFGIAKGGYGYPSVPFTRGTIRFATPYYAAPEQYKAQALSPATDVFALAATLYHAVTGERPPPVQERLYAIALDQRGDPLRPAHDVNPLVPRYLSQILALGMSLEILQRPTNAAQFRTMLEQKRADIVVDMANVSDIWGKPMNRYDVAGGGAPFVEPQRGAGNRIPSDRVPSDRVPSDRVRSDRVPSDRVRSDRVPSDRVRSDPVREAPPAPRPYPVPEARVILEGERGRFGNPMTIAAVVGVTAVVLIMLLLTFLPTETPGTGNSGASGTPTRAATATTAETATPETEPTPEEVPTIEVPLVPVTDSTPEATSTSLSAPTEAAEPTRAPGIVATSTRIQIGSPAAGATTVAVPTAPPAPTISTGNTGGTIRPTFTPLPAAPTAVPTVRLVAPAADASYRSDALMRFEWAWDGQLQGSQYFDLRIWRDGAPHRGVASFTGRSGEYRAEALGSGTYWWSVAVVDNNGAVLVAPEAAPRRLIID